MIHKFDPHVPKAHQITHKNSTLLFSQRFFTINISLGKYINKQIMLVSTCFNLVFHFLMEDTFL